MENPSQFYNVSRIGSIFYPDVTVASEQAATAKLTLASLDRLLVVDIQVGFCHSTGTLYVPGAQEDLQRLIRLIYRRVEQITTIISSLKLHLSF
jgi:hypothetical protein